MRLSYSAKSHVGLVRQKNEDAILVGDQIIRDDSDSFAFEMPEGGVVFPAIVCDGVGGQPRGEVASMVVCEHFRDFFRSLTLGLRPADLIMRLKQVATECNRKLLADGCGMCSTLTGLLVYGDLVYVLQSGDSRTYRLRYDNFKLLTTDHVNERDLLTNCLGMVGGSLDVTKTVLVEGDTYLVSSDGLFKYVPSDDIGQRLSSADELVDLALAAGGPDNVSVVSLRF